eukprot:5146671-Pleurochrysis_carterae.AAC.1
MANASAASTLHTHMLRAPHASLARSESPRLHGGQSVRALHPGRSLSCASPVYSSQARTMNPRHTAQLLNPQLAS